MIFYATFYISTSLCFVEVKVDMEIKPKKSLFCASLIRRVLWKEAIFIQAMLSQGAYFSFSLFKWVKFEAIHPHSII